MTLQHTHFISFGYIPRNKVAGLYGSCIFNFLRKWLAVSSNGCTKLHFQVSVEGLVLFTSRPHQHSVGYFLFLLLLLFVLFFSFLNSHFFYGSEVIIHFGFELHFHDH